jgi:single-strand DNA-binding protein
MNQPIVIEGNVTSDPEMRFSRGGNIPYLSFSVAVNDRRFDKNKNRWVDTKPIFHNVTLFNELAENAAETLRKGMQVLVVGKLTNNDWTDDAGVNHRRTELLATNIGPGLMFATAEVTKRTRTEQPADLRDDEAQAA